MKGAIFDIDGVLAETLPRVRIHLWEKTKPDWNSFYADQRYDKPIPWTFTFMRALVDQGYKIAILTGRPEQFRDDTTKWLLENGARYHVLWMRKDDDYTPPQNAKLEQLQRLRKRGWDVELAFEDHPETIQMYMDEGLMVYITPHFFSWKEGEVGRAGEELKPTLNYCDVGDFECGDSAPGPEPKENFLGGLEPIEMVASPSGLLKIEKAIRESLDVEKVEDFFDDLDKIDEVLKGANSHEAEGGNIDAPYSANSHKREERPHAVTNID